MTRLEKRSFPGIRRYEFWNPRVFEFPWYLYILARAALSGINPYHLLKADYGLDHGGLGFESKYVLQQQFGPHLFPPTILLRAGQDPKTKAAAVWSFAREHGYPVILKPDFGYQGRGTVIVRGEPDIPETVPFLATDYLCQDFVPGDEEYGIFYIRSRQKEMIFSINKKTYPTIVGDGASTIGTLIENHERYSRHWHIFLKDTDLDQVLPKGLKRQLSQIGSHTLGSMFTEDSHLNTPALEKKIFAISRRVKGFHFGRYDVKTPSIDALGSGAFTVLEVNGITSLPTNIFDPGYAIAAAYRILFEMTDWMVRIAGENRSQPMHLLPLRETVRRLRTAVEGVNRSHEALIRRRLNNRHGRENERLAGSVSRTTLDLPAVPPTP